MVRDQHDRQRTASGRSVAPAVIHTHPLVAVPPAVAALYAAMSHGPAAAQLTFLAAAGAAVLVELVVRRLVRKAWREDVWPPSQGEPAGLLPVAAAAAWSLLWSAGAWVASDAMTAQALTIGCKAAWMIALLQFGSWLTQARRLLSTTPQSQPHRDELLADHQTRR